jgi:hypothetical protein
MHNNHKHLELTKYRVYLAQSKLGDLMQVKCDIPLACCVHKNGGHFVG